MHPIQFRLFRIDINDFLKSFLKGLTNHDDVVQSMTWKEDGSLLATGCKVQ